MNKQQPLYFLNNNTFIYPDGKREYLNGQKEYITLPNKENYVVSHNSIWNAIKPVYIPISQMASNLKGYQFCNTIEGSENIGFYDIECDEAENFILGYVNEKKFINPEEMVKELMTYDIIVGFNIIKFDNHILKKYARDSFYEIKNADFVAYMIKNALHIDLLSVIQTIVGKDSYTQEALAMESNFPEKILSHKEDKDEKCKQDLRICKFLWVTYNIPKVFNIISTLANVDVGLLMVVPKKHLRKWILINKYLRQGYLPLKPYNPPKKMASEPFKLAKKGFFEDVSYWDIKSAYPQTAVNMGDLGIYPSESTFSDLQRELLYLAENPLLKEFMKSISNPLFGSQYSMNEFFKNEEIFSRVVKEVADKVSEKSKEFEGIYSNTDCWAIKGDKVIQLEGYTVEKKYKFSELYIYSVNKWIGKTIEGKIFSRGFSKLTSKVPQILSHARKEIMDKLKKTQGKEFKLMLDDENLTSNTQKNIKKFDIDEFKVIVRKTSDYCTDLNMAHIWASLKKGFNSLYYKDDGTLTTDEKKIGFKYIKTLIKDMEKEYNTEVLA